MGASVKKWPQIGLWSLFAALAVGVAYKLVPRKAASPWLAGDTAGLVRPSSLLGWEFTPDLPPINSRGMRGPEVSDYPDKGVRRVLIIGDSMTENARIPELLAEKTPSSGHSRLEFIQGGMRGYAPDTYLLWYRLYGRFLHPDLVVVFFTPGNDLSDIVKSKAYTGYQKPYFTLNNGLLSLHNYPLANPAKRYAVDELTSTVSQELGPLLSAQAALKDGQKHGGTLVPSRWELLYRIHYFLYDRFPPYRSLKNRVMNALQKNNPHEKARQLALGDLWYLRNCAYSFFTHGKAIDAAWRLNDALLEQLNKEVRQDGGRLVLCMASHIWQVDKNVGERFLKAAQEAGYQVDIDAPSRHLKDFSQRTRIPFLDPTPALKQASTAASPYDSLGSYAHWNELGYNTVAETLSSFLAQHRLLGKAPR